MLCFVCIFNNFASDYTLFVLNEGGCTFSTVAMMNLTSAGQESVEFKFICWIRKHYFHYNKFITIVLFF